jgi:hypothetical protein
VTDTQTAVTLTALNRAALAGDHQTLLDGKPAALSVAADGRITAAASSQ